MLFNFVGVERVVEEMGRRSSCDVGGAKPDDGKVIEHKTKRNAANCTGVGGDNPRIMTVIVCKTKLALFCVRLLEKEKDNVTRCDIQKAKNDIGRIRTCAN